MRAGAPNEELFDLLRSNLRVADQCIGDLMADIGGTEVGARLIGEFMSEFGLRDLQALADGVIGQSEQAMRARIRAIPDGVYRNALETEGVEGAIRLEAAVTVAGDAIAIDFAGSGPPARNAINVPLCYTRSFATYAVKCLTTPRVPNNQGTLLPLTVTAPEGCILNAQRPSPTGGRHVVGWFIVPLIMGALADALPDGVQAECGMASLFLIQGTHPSGRRVSTQYFLAGGLGAMRGLDGHQTTPSPTNNAVVSSEVWENETGMTVIRRRLLPDSGGPGRWRGGLGQEAVLRNDSGHPVNVALFGMRTEFPARGLFGGGDGTARRVMIDGEAVSAKGRYVLAPGQSMTVLEAGGGGFGSAGGRDPKLVEADVAAGFVTPEAARRDYGWAPAGSGARGQQ
jgi:N-methylhydantoinase B